LGCSGEERDPFMVAPYFQTIMIVNPKSANGATGRRWLGLRRVIETGFGGPFDVVFTEAPLHATELACCYLQRGYQLVVAVGGDGLINEVVNGFFDAGQNLFPEAALGILSVGSGGDFIKSLGWSRDLFTAALRLEGSETRIIDVGKAVFQNLQGETQTRYFLNMADFGAGGAVVERVNRTTKAFGGTLSFLWGILSTLPTYRNKEIRFSINGAKETSAILNNLIVANGKYYGGGLKSAPDAVVDDGLFQFVAVGDVTFPEVLLNLRRFRRGTYLTHPKVRSYVGKSLSAKSIEPVFIDMDGELVGTLPAVFEILPRAIRLKVSKDEGLPRS
jgi:YegS/Rv2252/BmrU family lipid kinase